MNKRKEIHYNGDLEILKEFNRVTRTFSKYMQVTVIRSVDNAGEINKE